VEDSPEHRRHYSEPLSRWRAYDTKLLGNTEFRNSPSIIHSSILHFSTTPRLSTFYWLSSAVPRVEHGVELRRRISPA
jgi:hypothetical protein